MAIAKKIRWHSNAGFDLHVMRGTTSVRMDKTLFLELDSGSTIEKFGNSRTARNVKYHLGIVSQNGQTQTDETLKESFAPGQFKELTQAEKLKRPSFVSMDAGVRVTSGETASYGAAHIRTTTTQAQQGASAQSNEQQAGINRFSSEVRYEAEELKETQYVIANRDDLQRADLEGVSIPEEGTSYYEALDALEEYVQIHHATESHLQVAPIS